MSIKKKSHTCREGGGMSQNFCLRFIDKLEKPPFVQKTFKVDQENYKNFNIYNVVFFLKRRTLGDIIILHLCSKDLDDMIYTS